ncbi:hypothetical protein [Demequina sp.]|uniref:hypothetical protein n=1 Tax=Demequina sp. TaxID=2050685 RepID=UPI003D1494A9
MTFAIGKPAINQDNNGITIESELTFGGSSTHVWFRVPERYAPSEESIGDAFLASMLPVAMGRGEDVVIDAPVSAKLLEGIESIQAIYASWYPKVMKRVSIEVEAAVTPQPSGLDRTFSCFTGGVDSFYTLVKNKDDLDAVLYVDGFDVPLGNIVLARKVHETVQSVADFHGKDAVFLATNLKGFTDREANWGLVAVGPALAGAGLILQGNFDTMLIPSSHSYRQMFPWGSHVMLDHLWTSDRLTVVHDGADASRIDKTLAISTEPSAFNYLRVCWQNKGPYNCGQCEKCLRTMTALEIMGALKDFTVFPETDLPAALRALKISGQNGLEFQLENLEYAELIGSTSAAVPALTAAVENFQKRSGGATGPAPTPYAGSRAAYVPALRREVAGLRKEVARLTKETAALRAEVKGKSSNPSLPTRAWRKAKRTVAPKKA